MYVSNNLKYIVIGKNKVHRRKSSKINVSEVKKLLNEIKDSVLDYVEEPSIR